VLAGACGGAIATGELAAAGAALPVPDPAISRVWTKLFASAESTGVLEEWSAFPLVSLPCEPLGVSFACAVIGATPIGAGWELFSDDDGTVSREFGADVAEARFLPAACNFKSNCGSAPGIDGGAGCGDDTAGGCGGLLNGTLGKSRAVRAV
jgi:hypothetical protein